MISLKKFIATTASVSMLLSSFNIVFAVDDTSAEETIVGGYGFENVRDYIGDRFLQSKEEQTLDLEGGVQIGLGARKDGANGNTGWYPSQVDSEHGTSLQANIGQYVSSARGPIVNFTISSNETSGKRVGVRFEYYPVNGNGNTADLIIYDPIGEAQVAYLTVGSELIENAWNDVEFSVETSGDTMLIVNNNIISSSDMTPSTYPQLKFTETNSLKDEQSLGNIDNVVLYTGGQFTDEQMLSILASQLVLDTSQDVIVPSEDGKLYNIYGDFDLPTSEADSLSWSVEQRLKGTEDEWQESQYVTVSGSKVTINNADEASKYDIRLIATLSYNAEITEKLFMLNIKSDSAALQEYAEQIQLIDRATGETINPDGNGIYMISGDLNLDTGNELITVGWNCYKEETITETNEKGEEIQRKEWVESPIISSNGELYPTDYTGNLKLTATLKFNDTELKKDFSVASTINSVTDYIDPTIENITVTSADDSSDIYDAKNIGTINHDIILPTNVKVDDGSVEVKWEIIEGEDNVTIDEDGLATIMTADTAEHNVELKATYTYVKNNISVISKEDEGYKFKVAFTEEDVNSDDTALDKYKVRFDAEYEENFEDIPTTTSSDIELPTKGMFGSTIKWTSNAPSVISNNGSVTRQKSNRDVTLTASIMSGAASETKTFDVTVRGKSSSSSSSGGGGGGSVSSVGGSSNVNTGGAIAGNNPGVITTPPIGQEVVDELVQQKEEAENRFTDIGSVSWARDAINGLYDAGIINGKTETTFAPNDNVTRAEFAKMLMGVFGLNSDAFTTSSFYDVSTSDWYFQSVESAYNLGIITGVAPAYFDPNANITRQDMAVMVVRAATVSGKAIPTVNEAKTFADESSIADYAKDAVSTLQVGGIIDGVTETTFAPNDNATRAQAAKILYSFL